MSDDLFEMPFVVATEGRLRDHQVRDQGDNCSDCLGAMLDRPVIHRWWGGAGDRGLFVVKQPAPLRMGDLVAGEDDWFELAFEEGDDLPILTRDNGADGFGFDLEVERH